MNTRKKKNNNNSRGQLPALSQSVVVCLVASEAGAGSWLNPCSCPVQLETTHAEVDSHEEQRLTMQSAGALKFRAFSSVPRLSAGPGGWGGSNKQ